MDPAASATLSTKPISGGGLLFHRHGTPLSRSAVAYFYADILTAVMRPLKSIRSVTPDTSLMSALEAMAHDDLNQLPVILDGRLAGVLSLSEVVAYLQTREELQNPKGSFRAA